MGEAKQSGEVVPWSTAAEAWAWILAQGGGISGSLDQFKYDWRYQDGVCEGLNLNTGDWVVITPEEFLAHAKHFYESEEMYAKMMDDQARSAEAAFWDDAGRQLARYGQDLPRWKRSRDCSICGDGGCPACCPEDFV